MESPYRSVIVPRRELPPTYAEIRGGEENLELLVTLRDPDGQELDVTGRIIDELGQIEESVEIDLLELAHGDVELLIDDRDGEVARFLSGAEAGEEWEVRILRETGLRRPKWDTLFAGILDLPWSLVVDHRENTVSVRVFSFSKILETASAETVQILPQAMRGSVSAGSALVTVTPDVSDLRIGDEFTLDNQLTRDTRTVSAINSATNVITADATIPNAYSNAPLTNDTPYHRNKSTEFLIDALFKAAGIKDFSIRLPSQGVTRPQAIKADTRGAAVVDVDSPDPSGFEASADHVSEFEWSMKFVSGSPNAIQLRKNNVLFVNLYAAAVISLNRLDGDWDPVNNWWWHSGAQNTAVPPTVRTVSGAYKIEEDSFISFNLPFDTGNSNEVIGKWRSIGPLHLIAFKSNAGNPDDTKLYVYDLDDPQIGPGGTIRPKQTITVPSGLFVKSLRAAQSIVGAIRQDGGKTFLRLWDASNRNAWIQIADTELAATAAERPKLTVWKDAIPTFLAYAEGKYFEISGSPLPTVKSLNTTGLGTATPPDYIIDNNGKIDIQLPSAPKKLYRATGPQSGFTEIGESTAILIDWHPYGLENVIFYADFFGMSVALALRELAVDSASYVTITHGREGVFQTRTLETDEPTDIETPLSRRDLPLWEFFRNSVQVNGKTAAGGAIDVIVGDAGESARRLSVSSRFVQSTGKAQDVGELYLDFLNVDRRESAIEIPDRGLRVPLLAKVGMAGATWRVIESSIDPVERIQSLRMFELGV